MGYLSPEISRGQHLVGIYLKLRIGFGVTLRPALRNNPLTCPVRLKRGKALGTGGPANPSIKIIPAFRSTRIVAYRSTLQNAGITLMLR